MKRLRMGAISFDHGHQYGWCSAHLQLPMVELVAVSEWMPEQVDRVKSTLVSSDGAMRALDDPEQGSVAYYEDYQELLARDDIDAVSISSANAFHLEHTEAAAQAGKHVILEKPLATNLEDATRIVTVCDEAGVHLSTAYPTRFSPSATEAKRRVDAGEIGEIVSMHATNHLRRATTGWFVDPELSGGGTIRDHIVHGTDQMRWFSGKEVISIYAEGDTLARPEIAVDDVAMLIETFEGGIVGSCDPSWNRPMTASKWGDVMIRILGTEGAIDFDITGCYVSRTLAGGSQQSEAWEAAGVQGYVSHMSYQEDANVWYVKDFAESILDGRKPSVDGIDGWYGVACIEAAYQSVREHCEVEVPTFPDAAE